MSGILITTLVIFVVCGIIGWYKGIIRIVVSIAALVVAILATAFLSPLVSQTLKKNTNLYNHLCESMYQVVDQNQRVSEAVDETLAEHENLSIAEQDIEEYEDIISAYLDRVNGSVNLPDEFGDTLSQISTNEYINGVVDGETTIREMLVKAFAVRLADVIFQAIVYIIIFAIIYVILRVVVIATGIIAKLPVIHGANKCLGLVFGLVEGLLIVWLIYTVLTAMSGAEYATVALSDINNNWLMKFLYDNNVIMKLIFR